MRRRLSPATLHGSVCGSKCACGGHSSICGRGNEAATGRRTFLTSAWTYWERAASWASCRTDPGSAAQKRNRTADPADLFCSAETKTRFLSTKKCKNLPENEVIYICHWLSFRRIALKMWKIPLMSEYFSINQLVSKHFLWIVFSRGWNHWKHAELKVDLTLIVLEDKLCSAFNQLNTHDWLKPLNHTDKVNIKGGKLIKTQTFHVLLCLY